ncbi:MAG TPA: glyceraldehyde 3-phosphate dehydrogenase NAD-binding domain-containing protein, partial [Flavitalea sp.]|nr:glyceraldehyde 3-phosphate dehydrogenase NAD-binding domain-containing protein [Flavitalea sp.]
MKRIAINGFGRIGRATLKIVLENKDIEVVAINDLMAIENAAYLLGFDSVYGRLKGNIRTESEALYVNDKKIVYCSEKDPAKLPWKDLNIEAVIESTGF